MAIKRSPLGRDPLEWIKVTKQDGPGQGTAGDRQTEGTAQAAPASPPQPPKTGVERLLEETASPVPSTAPVEEAERQEAPTPAEPPKPAPSEPEVAPAPPLDKPIVITTYTPPVEPTAPQAETPVKPEEGAGIQAEAIPLFAKMEAEKEEGPPSATQTDKPSGQRLGLEEVSPGEAKVSVLPEEGAEKVEVPAEALAKPPEAAPLGGHSVNFMAPGVGAAETVAAPAPPEESKPEKPLEVPPPESLKTLKVEEITTPIVPPPDIGKPERIHVGPVDLRVQRKPIPVPTPANKEKPAEVPLSFAHVLFYVCIPLLLMALVLSAFFANRGQVANLRRQVQSLENKIQKMLPQAVPSRTPDQR